MITGDRDSFFSKTKQNEKYIKILTGSDILKYGNLEPNEYVLFEKPKSAGGCWDREMHLAPFKICIRQIGSEPTATIVQQPYAVTGNIFTVLHDDLRFLKYLLGVINSKFIKYFWKIVFHDFKTTFPQVTINSLNSIPIILDKIEVKEEIINYVSLILELDENDNQILVLQDQIDQLVYQLYELTEEEIRIIEGINED
ncbi:TaqI-like C-terminal specificity domain-containing protein [Sphingobacterium daejeonense]|uniref:TaqI-like C-terminal specificity domain-containing protein n=1 Tax=Sphingobacterium daejeonense TaxID=371142 RepID=UPI0010C36F1B|nr:TaqI-like C-terminal specificity domain-containing protein [Sphingobacterium daejeonense]VTP95819.1 TaqI-like C-terminal specificity domain [Sphingobacterium daejeonense]